MLKRSIVLFSFGVAAVLFGVSQTEAQPGKGAKGGGDIQKLEKDVAQLLETVKAISADLARIKADAGKKGFGPGGFGPFGPGGFGKDGPGKLDPDTIKQKFEFYKKLYDELPKEKGKSASKSYEGRYSSGGYGRWRGGFDSKKGPEGKGGSIEARIDRLIRELEELRSEVKGAKGPDAKKGFEGKRGFEPKKKYGGEDE
jgi:outer membrane murein-binding lipoprotein Lpp